MFPSHDLGAGGGQSFPGGRAQSGSTTNVVEGPTLQGLIRFNRDIVQGDGQTNTTSLSDSWKIRFTGEFPSTPPYKYKTDEGGWNDSSDYNESEVGYMWLKLQRSNNGTSGWTDVPITLLAEPKLRLFYGTTQIDLNLRNVLGQNNAGLRNANKQLYIDIHVTDLDNAVNNLGRNIEDADYCSFIVSFESNEILRADRYYRINTRQFYNNETIDADRNYCDRS